MGKVWGCDFSYRYKIMENTETSKRRYEEARRMEVDVGLQVVTGIGGKTTEDGGGGQLVRCKRRGNTDRGEQKKTLLIKEGAQGLKNFGQDK